MADGDSSHCNRLLGLTVPHRHTVYACDAIDCQERLAQQAAVCGPVLFLTAAGWPCCEGNAAILTQQHVCMECYQGTGDTAAAAAAAAMTVNTNHTMSGVT